MERTCSKCRFWVAAGQMPRNQHAIAQDGGECRRRAPVGASFTAKFAEENVPQRMFAMVYPWPITHEADWCGEYISAEITND